MATYARGEFTDDYGYDWKVEIEDTLHTGSVYTMQMAGDGFTRTYDGIQGDNLLFQQIFQSQVSATVLIDDNYPEIAALISAIANGKEDQYYMKIYKENVLWFAGMILCDLCEYEDLDTFIYTITAKEGFNRLENFDFPIESVPGDYITQLDAILLCLKTCGVARFYSASENYLASSIRWFENTQSTTKGTLYNTRVLKESLIADIKENRPKNCKQVIEEILLPYGANIRFEEGMWRITQLETFNQTNIGYYYYTKLGKFKGQGSELITATIGSNNNNTLNVQTRAYLNSLNGTVVTCKQESIKRWGVEQAVTSQLIKTIPITIANKAFKLKVNLSYNAALQNGRSVVGQYQISTNISIGNWSLIGGQWQGGNFNPTLMWVRNDNLRFANSGYVSPFFLQEPKIVGLTYFNIELEIPALNVSGDLIIKTSLLNQSSKAITFTSYYSELSQVIDDSEVSYLADNNIFNAASIFLEKESVYCDSTINVSPSTLQIYTGSVWQNSSTWVDASVGPTPIPLLQLLAKKSVFFQRYPRNQVIGELILPVYSSLYTMVWRSVRHVFQNGTFNARRSQWQGFWVEISEQSTNVNNGPTNPYRNQATQLINEIADIKALLFANIRNVNDLQGQFKGVVGVVNNIKKKTDFGVDGFLLNNVTGIEGAMSAGETKTLSAVKTADGIKLEFTAP